MALSWSAALANFSSVLPHIAILLPKMQNYDNTQIDSTATTGYENIFTLKKITLKISVTDIVSPITCNLDILVNLIAIVA